MKTSFLGVSCAVACVAANPHYARQGSVDSWAPGGPDDFRGPCPMMNTLANHGFLPHDGRNLTEEVVVSALHNGINFDPSLGSLMFQMALIANPEPNATFFTLDMLNVHNVLEHDASMSRSDAAFGNNHVFNETIFDETIQYWTKDVLDANQLAMGKVARQVSSKAFNPDYTFTETTEQFSLGEVAAPIIVFGDMTTSTVNRTFVEYFFRNERLPSELGWTPQAVPVVTEDANAQSGVIAKAANLFTPTANSTTATKRRVLRDLHAGFAASG